MRGQWVEIEQRIIDEAAALLALPRTKGASVNAIAAREGVPAGTLYNHARKLRAQLDAAIKAERAKNNLPIARSSEVAPGIPFIRPLTRYELMGGKHAA